MSRFNTKTITSNIPDAINLAGGVAFSQTPELKLISILLTSFGKDQFYRSADDTFKELKSLIQQCDKKFVAKASIYARKEFGMRTITHVIASELAKYISGETWSKDYYKSIVHRPDDMMEILSYHKTNNCKIPNAMKKGFALAFNNINAYGLAKYRGEGKTMKLVDVVNLVHPMPTEKNREALKQLVDGTLKLGDEIETWESVSSQPNRFSSNKEKWEYIVDMWIDVNFNTKNYFAILRNLRNLIQADISGFHLKKITQILQNENVIKKSLVLPFRYLTAFQEVNQVSNDKNTRLILSAINNAVEISLNNVPKFDGDTLVVLDESGSMSGQPAVIGALFASVLIKANNADLITFANNARYRKININDSITTISSSISFNGGGTDFHSIFKTANKKYDRIIILSDMQGWIGNYSPVTDFNRYKNLFNANPFVYSFDLNGYGSMQFPENKVFCIAGFSEKVFDIMNLMESNKNALIETINNYSF